MTDLSDTSPAAMRDLTRQIRTWARELGFQQVGISDGALPEAERHLADWLDAGYHGDMDYMRHHGSKRSRVTELVPGTRRVISVRMDYLPAPAADPGETLANPERAFIARYALGRDYHKLMRKRLQRLADRIRETHGAFGYRAIVDSAPAMEKPLAAKAGLGWIGKHTLLLNRHAGSWFFLGELLTDLPLPVDAPVSNHCGSCSACMQICPTQAIIAPYVLDARRCIAYFTIESHEAIPPELRPAMGNRVFGCDDCQMVCPWNRYAQFSAEPDFAPRHGLDTASLRRLFGWTEDTFLARTEGSAIRRLGHVRWLRNLAVALGNAAPSEAVREALRQRLDHPSEMVREHVRWGLDQQMGSEQ
ncbi:tRNA epoxyqueuosine(34) reductase QueG [Methylonatrum kenyense]|uniref:tRNA epoxyqueuosine(34) reductase QueG n=1 Tax=Methylonatrum kenyense TaxID=455253 RepID=UPI0020BD5663|nr:tRNA epoxyqueuosine(34) reductase QueG [Methylonatrum kenyense]MCK8516115.1 tRNA epoxyqueuosine(34) reductase QueG [Methylonatrum kenyense]